MDPQVSLAEERRRRKIEANTRPASNVAPGAYAVDDLPFVGRFEPDEAIRRPDPSPRLPPPATPTNAAAVPAEPTTETNRSRTVLLVIIVLMLVIGAVIGLAVGLSGNEEPLSGNEEPPSNSGTEEGSESTLKDPSTIAETPLADFDDYTLPAETCFETTEELYLVVESYIDLRSRVNRASEEDYRFNRNEFLVDRDAISTVYGWPIGQFCVSKLTSLAEVFTTYRSFNEDLSGWNTSNVQNMDGTFQGCQRFNQPLAAWDTSRVTSMTRMFSRASSFNQDVGGWNVERVTSTDHMFAFSSMFNQDLSRWNVSSLVRMSLMFDTAGQFHQPSTCEWGFTLPQVSDDELGSRFGMFFQTACPQERNSFPNQWPRTNICVNCEEYFENKLNQTNPSNGDGSLPARNGFASRADLERAVDVYMAYRLGRPDYIPGNASQVQLRIAATYGWPIGEWDVSLVEDFSFLFAAERSRLMALFNDDISTWDVSNGRTFDGMFAGAVFFDENYSPRGL